MSRDLLCKRRIAPSAVADGLATTNFLTESGPVVGRVTDTASFAGISSVCIFIPGCEGFTTPKKCGVDTELPRLLLGERQVGRAAQSGASFQLANSMDRQAGSLPHLRNSPIGEVLYYLFHLRVSVAAKLVGQGLLWQL